MLFVSIHHPQLLPSISHCDGVELRLDLFPSWDLDLVDKILSQSLCPVMLTLRGASQGGKFRGSEEDREAAILALLRLKPDFMDLEYDMRRGFLDDVLTSYPDTCFILSYHNFENTPIDLERIFQAMAVYPAYHYKIAAMALSASDVLRMLLFSRERSEVSVITMGERGEFGRILSPIAGNVFQYASVDFKEQTGPGQLSVHELVDIYHFSSLHRGTAIYGLIGDPVEKSQGHLYHNRVFRKRGWDAVYVKMRVEPDELPEFIPLAIAMGICGLSVTIPLKEKILPFLDAIDPVAKQMGAVNTLLIKKGRIIGTNTDGRGALDAIASKMSVHGKKMVLLGAGGAARAIAFEAKARGAEVLVLNRTVQRAKGWALDLGCRAGGLDEMPNDYDILINCSPEPMPIDPEKIRSGILAMDVVYCPRETDFLKEAALKECQIVYGEEMFRNQAALQTAFWT